MIAIPTRDEWIRAHPGHFLPATIYYGYIFFSNRTDSPFEDFFLTKGATMWSSRQVLNIIFHLWKPFTRHIRADKELTELCKKEKT